MAMDLAAGGGRGDSHRRCRWSVDFLNLDFAIRGDEWGTLDVAFNVANRGVFSKTQPETELDFRICPDQLSRAPPPSFAGLLA